MGQFFASGGQSIGAPAGYHGQREPSGPAQEWRTGQGNGGQRVEEFTGPPLVSPCKIRGVSTWFFYMTFGVN